MRGCDQELCAHWTGQGCACDLLDIEPHQFTTSIMDAFANLFDALVKLPPFSWLDWILAGPVGPKS